ncbi:MAG TPA: SulP family inorganic anion transporter [Anaerolineaceae bacterium]|nr:SulP family inorganic anion transporter [Anaerolineaceae bacterium]HQF62106.1 SulP family inorganic anion transporter [Anaerolineaceae bacterium]HQH85218.1 SulP family inorganic anion transporter [Anaerolineaceae bacterium]
MPRRSLKRLYQDEFRGYTFARFQQDLLAGLTVSAVALPLALAFGVASGATAAAGLVTAIIAGFIIGGLSGAPYQISGPTGAMSAVLIVLVQKYGLQGIWIAGLLSGALLLVIGLLRLGRFIAFIPAPVITGFTTGIALIIFIGQIDNFLGVKTAASESALFKLLGYFKGGFTPDWHAVVLGLVVVLTMLLWPKKLNARFPASLLGIILATGLNALVKWDVAQIGAIPQTLLLADRFNPLTFDWSTLPEFIAPALTITALGAIESLLCGAVASNMTGIRLQANQELVGQGIGNMLIPFFGGVPATAAIARSSVGIKSGGQTRLVSIIHAVGLLLSMFLLAPVMARVPLAALAGVLLVTAWRMNEWDAIRFMFGKRFKTAMLAFTITMLATITLDLTQAILIGSLIAAGIFLSQIANIDITVQDVDPAKLRAKGIEAEGKCAHVKVAFVTGPLFFAATGNFNEAFASLGDTHALILSLRGMPVIDVAGVEAIHRLHEKLHRRGGTLMLAGVHENVMTMLRRSGLVDEIGAANFFWSSDQAIVEAEHRGCGFCGLPLTAPGSDQI